MAFEVYDIQRWKLSKELYKKLDTAKIVPMINYRIMNNLSQHKAAKLADLPAFVWMNVENKRMVPTESEAIRIGYVVGINPHQMFPLMRSNTAKILPLKNFSKLAFIRCSRNITQTELAKNTGIPLKIIHKLEREWYAIADIPKDMLVKVHTLADYLGEDIVNIIGEVY